MLSFLHFHDAYHFVKNRAKHPSAAAARERAAAWDADYGAAGGGECAVVYFRHCAQAEAAEEHHLRMTFQEEYLQFLKKHRIEFPGCV